MKHWLYFIILLFLGCKKNDDASSNNTFLANVGSTSFYNLKSKSMIISDDNTIVILYHSDDSIKPYYSNGIISKRNERIFLKKFTFDGTLIWTMSDSTMRYGYCVAQTNDGGYIITGENDNEDAFLLKTNSKGEKQWANAFHYPFCESYGINVIQTQDNGYLILVDKEIKDYRLIKTNSLGDTIWTKKYNWTTMNLNQMDLSELFISDFKILDNKILIIGNCIIQTDMNGNLEWYKKVKINFNHGYSVNSFQEIDKNIFCLGGEIGNSIFINKLNNSGDSIWNKPILTGNNIESSDIEKTNDLNFIFTTSDLSLPEYQTRILKVNPNGDIIWSVQPYLCRQYERGISIKQLDNNHYILLATIKNDNGYGSNKLMLYKIEK